MYGRWQHKFFSYNGGFFVFAVCETTSNNSLSKAEYIVTVLLNMHFCSFILSCLHGKIQLLIVSVCLVFWCSINFDGFIRHQPELLNRVQILVWAHLLYQCWWIQTLYKIHYACTLHFGFFLPVHIVFVTVSLQTLISSSVSRSLLAKIKQDDDSGEVLHSNIYPLQTTCSG